MTVVVVGYSSDAGQRRSIFALDEQFQTLSRQVENINPYLAPGPNVFVSSFREPVSSISQMDKGSGPVDGGHLMLEPDDREKLELTRLVAVSCG